MILKQLAVGELETNCSIMMDEETRACAVVDPGDDAQRILDEIAKLGGKAEAIFLTHGHFDHMLAAQKVKEETGAKLYIHKSDLPFMKQYNARFTKGYRQPEADAFLEEGMEIKIGGLTVTVLNTPGHSKGSCVLLCEGEMFAGDTLFCHDCGRWDLPGGSKAEMYRSLKRLHNLPGDYDVYPGHGPFSTLAEERRENPYMKEALTQ